MPASPRETVLCRYRYDPLDRLADCAPSAETGIQRFYCKSRLATEIQGAVQRSVFQHDAQLLAQHLRKDAKVETALLATDQRRSVLNVLDANRVHPLAYSPYGHRPAENGLLSLLGFNGERPDPVTGHYLLGNGYRAFNPVLMRFNTPDSLSPFGEGGLNAFGYCGGDSINRSDPTGHFWGLGTLLSRLGIMSPKKNTVTTVTTASQTSSRGQHVGTNTEPGHPLNELYGAADNARYFGTPLIYQGNNINPIPRLDTYYAPISLDQRTPAELYIMGRHIRAKNDHRNVNLVTVYPDIYDTILDPIVQKASGAFLYPAENQATAIHNLERALEETRMLNIVDKYFVTPHTSKRVQDVRDPAPLSRTSRRHSI